MVRPRCRPRCDQGARGFRKRLGLCQSPKKDPILHRALIAPKFKRNSSRRPQKRRRGDRGRGHQRTVDRNVVPWILATNLLNHSPQAIMSLYAPRMQSEETFRDTKSVRFGWSFRHAKSGSSERYLVMLLLAALAGRLPRSSVSRPRQNVFIYAFRPIPFVSAACSHSFNSASSYSPHPTPLNLVSSTSKTHSKH